MPVSSRCRGRDALGPGLGLADGCDRAVGDRLAGGRGEFASIGEVAAANGALLDHGDGVAGN